MTWNQFLKSCKIAWATEGAQEQDTHQLLIRTPKSTKMTLLQVAAAAWKLYKEEKPKPPLASGVKAGGYPVEKQTDMKMLIEKNLCGADLRGADLPLHFTLDPDLKRKIREQIEMNPDGLKMRDWHSCDTTHCIAGWAVMLHPDGAALEAASNTYLAGRLLLFGQNSDPEEANIFYASTKEALIWLMKS